MLFISTSGALGRYIALPVPVIIGLRALLALGFLYIYCKLKGISLRLDKKDALAIIGSGFFMGLHWITYFYALKLSSVAIGMLSMFTYPILTAFLEPLLLKTKLQKIHLFLGILVLAGIYFLVPNFNFQDSNTLAVGIGMLSALCYALRNLILKRSAGSYNGSMLMYYQMVIVSVIIIPIAFSLFPITIEEVFGEWIGITALALVTTAIGHTIFLNSFKHFSITTVSILSSIQPVFGIIIGAIFLKEFPEATTLIGGALILTSVVIESVRSYRN